MRIRDDIDELTHRLRSDPDAVWARMRSLLGERGVDPSKSLLLDFFTDDSNLYWGLVVTPDRRAIQFDYAYAGREPSDGTFASWTDVTDATEFTHAGLVEAGLFRWDEEKGAIL